MPTKIGQNFEMRSGDDRVLKVTVTDADAGGLKNLTGATIVWRLSRKIGGPAVITKQSGGQGIEIPVGTDGVFEVTLAPADTAGLRGDFVHEAEVTDSDGKKATVTVGRLTIHRDMIE